MYSNGYGEKGTECKDMSLKDRFNAWKEEYPCLYWILHDFLLIVICLVGVVVVKILFGG